MRGEKKDCYIKRVQIVGSSPHARGKDSKPDLYTSIVRIIPACAGKSDKLSFFGKDNKDHPRMRGEKAKEIS